MKKIGKNRKKTTKNGQNILIFFLPNCPSKKYPGESCQHRQLPQRGFEEDEAEESGGRVHPRNVGRGKQNPFYLYENFRILF